MLGSFLGIALIAALCVVGVILGLRLGATPMQNRSIVAAFAGLAFVDVAFVIVVVVQARTTYSWAFALASIVLPIVLYVVSMVIGRSRKRSAAAEGKAARRQSDAARRPAPAAPATAVATPSLDDLAMAMDESRGRESARQRRTPRHVNASSQELLARDARRRAADASPEPDEFGLPEYEAAAPERKPRRGARRPRPVDEPVAAAATAAVEPVVEPVVEPQPGITPKVEPWIEFEPETETWFEPESQPEPESELEVVDKPQAEVKSEPEPEPQAEPEPEPKVAAAIEKPMAEKPAASVASTPEPAAPVKKTPTTFSPESYFKRATVLRDAGAFLVATKLYAECASLTSDQDIRRKAIMQQITCFVKGGDLDSARELARNMQAKFELTSTEQLKIGAVLGAKL